MSLTKPVPDLRIPGVDVFPISDFEADAADCFPRDADCVLGRDRWTCRTGLWSPRTAFDPVTGVAGLGDPELGVCFCVWVWHAVAEIIPDAFVVAVVGEVDYVGQAIAADCYVVGESQDYVFGVVMRIGRLRLRLIGLRCHCSFPLCNVVL